MRPLPARSFASGTSSSAIAANSSPPPNDVSRAATRAAIVQLSVPVLTAIAAVLLLGEQVRPRLVALGAGEAVGERSGRDRLDVHGHGQRLPGRGQLEEPHAGDRRATGAGRALRVAVGRVRVADDRPRHRHLRRGAHLERSAQRIRAGTGGVRHRHAQGCAGRRIGGDRDGGHRGATTRRRSGRTGRRSAAATPAWHPTSSLERGTPSNASVAATATTSDGAGGRHVVTWGAIVLGGAQFLTGLFASIRDRSSCSAKR